MKNYIPTIAYLLGLSFALHLALIATLALFFQWAWNSVLPHLFHLPMIDYLDAAAFLTLVAVGSLVVKGVKLNADFKA
jgi:hypothetical protein